MTVAAEAPARVRRGGQGVWVALALSLTLNVFLVGGLGWAMFEGQRVLPPTQRFLVVGRSLGLNATQRAALHNFALTAHEAGAKLRQGNEPLMREIWDELAKPNPDQTAIQHDADSLLQNRRDYQHAMTQGLIAFLATLSPNQRDRFTALAHHPIPPHRILRFVLP